MYSKNQIATKVKHLVNKYGVYNPFNLADCLHIQIIRYPLGNVWGFYMLVRRNKQIYINSEIEEVQQIFTCSHELGHAVLHSKENCPFMRANTLFLADRLEIEANTFAAYLMFPSANDELYTPEQVATTLKITTESVLCDVAYKKVIF
jgi:Zn-dependent peptidase ImmA (M78 family)